MKGFLSGFFSSQDKNKKKFFFLFLTLFFKTVINFFLIFYVAKVSSISDFGSFTLSFVVMTIGVLFIDYGYNLQALVLNYTNKNNFSTSISSILSGKVLITTTLVLLSILFVMFSSLEKKDMYVITILSVSAIPNSFGNFFFALFKAKNEYKQETIGFLIQGSLLIVFIILNHFFGSKDIVAISFIVLLTKVIYFCYAWFIFRSEFLIKFRMSFSNGIQSLKNSISFGTHLILGTLILYIDTLFLSYFTDMETVGYYQSGLRLIMAASLLGAIITDGFVPEISRNLENKAYVTNKMINLFSFLIVFYALLLITIGFYFKTIVSILFSSEFIFIGKYLIYILGIILLRAIAIVPGVILTSGGLQRIRAIAVSYSCLLSVVLNFILIPIYGLEGAFISFLSTNILLTSIYFYFGMKEMNFYKVVLPNILVILIIYLLLQTFLSKDNFLFLLASIIINLLIQFFAQKSLKKRNIYVADRK